MLVSSTVPSCGADPGKLRAVGRRKMLGCRGDGLPGCSIPQIEKEQAIRDWMGVSLGAAVACTVVNLRTDFSDEHRKLTVLALVLHGDHDAFAPCCPSADRGIEIAVEPAGRRPRVPASRQMLPDIWACYWRSRLMCCAWWWSTWQLVEPVVIPHIVVPVPEAVMITGVDWYVPSSGLVSGVMDIAPPGGGGAVGALDARFDSDAARVDVHSDDLIRAIGIASIVWGHVQGAVAYGNRGCGACGCGDCCCGRR